MAESDENMNKPINDSDHISDVIDNLTEINVALSAYLKSRKLRDEIRTARMDRKRKFEEKEELLGASQESTPYSPATDERIGQFNKKIEDEKKIIHESRSQLKTALNNLLEIRSGLLKRKESGEKLNQAAIDDIFFLKTRVDELRKVRNLLELEIIALNELKKIENEGIALGIEPEDIIEKIEDEIDLSPKPSRAEVSAESEEERNEARLKAEVASVREEIARGIENEGNKIADEGGFRFYWLMIKKPVAGFAAGVVAFFVKGIYAPLRDSMKELQDSWRSLKRGGKRHVANGLFKGSLILGGAGVLGYGIALGVGFIGVAALLANPLTLTGLGIFLGVLAGSAIIAHGLKLFSKAASKFADSLFDKSIDIYTPSKTMIKLQGKENAHEVAMFFKQEIDNIKKNIESTKIPEVQKIYKNIQALLENTFQTLQKTNNKDEFVKIWRDGIDSIHQKHIEINYFLVDKHIKRVNEGVEAVIREKPKRKEEKLQQFKKEVRGNRDNIVNQLKLIQEQWVSLKEKSDRQEEALLEKPATKTPKRPKP